MADLSSPTRVAASWAMAPARVRIGILYLAARVVTTGFLLLAANLSTFGSRFGPDATLAKLVTGWDAQWYWYVAVHGYPAVLPLTESGQVAENQWAFMPIYAYLAEAVGLPFGAWAVGARDRLARRRIPGEPRAVPDADAEDRRLRSDLGGRLLRRRAPGRAVPGGLRRVTVPALAVSVALGGDEAQLRHGCTCSSR